MATTRRCMSGPTIAAIQRRVAAHYGLEVNALVSSSRTRDLVRPRHVAMWLCRQLTRSSPAAIGRRFGDRDRKAVVHACRRVESCMAADASLSATVQALRTMIATPELAAEGGGAVRGVGEALKDEARALRERADRLDALSDALMQPAETGSRVAPADAARSAPESLAGSPRQAPQGGR